MLLTRSNAERIGHKLGRLVAVEDPAMLSGTGTRYLRVRVAFNITDPLVARFWVPKGNAERIWAAIHYEKLLDFCYACGKLGHVQKYCSHEVAGFPKFGPQMRALPPRRGAMMREPSPGRGVRELEEDEVNSVRGGNDRHWSNDLGKDVDSCAGESQRKDGYGSERVSRGTLSWKNTAECDENSMVRESVLPGNKGQSKVGGGTDPVDRWMEKLGGREARWMQRNRGNLSYDYTHNASMINAVIGNKIVSNDMRTIRERITGNLLNVLELNVVGVLNQHEKGNCSGVRIEEVEDGIGLENQKDFEGADEVGVVEVNCNKGVPNEVLVEDALAKDIIGLEEIGNEDRTGDSSGGGFKDMTGTLEGEAFNSDANQLERICEGSKELEIVDSELSADLRRLKNRKERDEVDSGAVMIKKQKITKVCFVETVSEGVKGGCLGGRGSGRNSRKGARGVEESGVKDLRRLR
ncbi:Zinc knuckle CX2CX4HX4C [Corchorus olitorius]|uniref:Zinc knuckle CX2CX4HX4C n=1 Tax=Corchorus olitorius TaxID=93759 RepID=A0A1R3HE87_9ROSI|nr:Zinc knuckle CX2CX4HX4C [Corchorus olitorius]